jgi:hypothetical protein
VNKRDFKRTAELLRVGGRSAVLANHVGSHFGSWIVEAKTQDTHIHVAWDGRDRWLILQEGFAAAQET